MLPALKRQLTSAWEPTRALFRQWNVWLHWKQMPSPSLQTGEGPRKDPLLSGEGKAGLAVGGKTQTYNIKDRTEKMREPHIPLKNLKLQLSLSRSRAKPLSRHAWTVLIENPGTVSFCLSSPILSPTLIFRSRKLIMPPSS